MIVDNEETEELVVFAVNKDLEEDMEVTCDLRQYADYKVREHIVLHDEDLKAVNTEDDPFRIRPEANGTSAMDGGLLTAVLKHKSWNVIRLGK